MPGRSGLEKPHVPERFRDIFEAPEKKGAPPKAPSSWPRVENQLKEIRAAIDRLEATLKELMKE
jgi:hypothetical protein